MFRFQNLKHPYTFIKKNLFLDRDIYCESDCYWQYLFVHCRRRGTETTETRVVTYFAVQSVFRQYCIELEDDLRMKKCKALEGKLQSWPHWDVNLALTWRERGNHKRYVNRVCVPAKIWNEYLQIWPCHSSGGQLTFSHRSSRVRSQANSCGICGGQSGTRRGFFRVLRFPLPILIPPVTIYSSIIRCSYNRPISDQCTKRTQSHTTPGH
jgi:hypothetical protein